MPAADRCRLCYPRGERHGPLSAACAEPDNLRTLTAMTHTSNWRPESVLGACRVNVRPEGTDYVDHDVVHEYVQLRIRIRQGYALLSA